jgi:hypothetical protein
VYGLFGDMRATAYGSLPGTAGSLPGTAGSLPGTAYGRLGRY